MKKILKLNLILLLVSTCSCTIVTPGGSSSEISSSISSSSVSSSEVSSESSSRPSTSSSESVNNSSSESTFISSNEISSETSSESSSSTSTSKPSSSIVSSETSSEVSSDTSSSESSFDWVSSMETSSSNSSSSSSSSSEEIIQVFTLTYVYNDGKTSNKTIKSLQEVPTLEIPSREGYSFLGWYYESIFENKVIEGDELDSNIIIYAKWEELNEKPIMYNVSFENDEGYEASKNYINTTPRVIGKTLEWSVIMGTPSQTEPINGKQSLQMRFYTSKKDTLGCLVSNYSFDDVESISFYAKSTGENSLSVSKSSDGLTWTNTQTFTLSTSGEKYTYFVSNVGEDVYLKFNFVVSPNKVDKSRVTIDDIVIYGEGNGLKLPEIGGDIGDYDMSTIPLSKENVLSELSNIGSDKGGITQEKYNVILNTINSYYASINSTYKGETLWNALTEATSIPNSQIRSYGELKEDLFKTDYSEDDPTKIVDMYSGLTFNGTWNADVWNREHIWCQSHSWYNGVGESSRNAGTDLHHIRPLYSSINSSRNNSMYGEISNRNLKAKYFNTTDTVNATASNGTLYGYLDDTIDPKPSTEKVNEGVFEPTDRVKGDVARILMYMMIRYPSYVSSYPITNIIYTSEGSISSAYALLLKWHQQDPVSNFEIRRNQKTYEIQGNRNPFIDNPTYADLIFRNL